MKRLYCVKKISSILFSSVSNGCVAVRMRSRNVETQLDTRMGSSDANKDRGRSDASVAQFMATQICGKGLECIFGRVDNKAGETRSKNRFTIVRRTIFNLVGKIEINSVSSSSWIDRKCLHTLFHKETRAW